MKPDAVVSLARGVFGESAPHYWSQGFSVVPVWPGEKATKIPSWQAYAGNPPNPDRQRAWLKDHGAKGIGLLAGRLVDKDAGLRLGFIDCDDDRFIRVLDAIIGTSSVTKIGKKGKTVFVLYAAGMKSQPMNGPSADGGKVRIFDVLPLHVVLPPTLHPDTHRPYRWVGQELLKCDLASLPRLDRDKLRLLRLVAESEHAPVLIGGEATHDAALSLSAKLVAAGASDEQVAAVIGALLPEGYEGNTLKELPRMCKDARAKNIDKPTRKPSQADILVELLAEASLFHTPAGVAFADLEVNGHRETHPVRSRAHRLWLARQFFVKTGGAPSDTAMEQALAQAEARARFDAPETETFLRCVRLNDKTYIDLCDADWRAVEIDAAGWRVIDRPPVRFRRASGMLSLPEPTRGGDLRNLREFVNVDPADSILVIAWLLAALGGRGPFPVLVLCGQGGAAKTFTARVLRALVDPNTVSQRAPPRHDHDLFIAANNAHVVALDNVSRLPEWLSDTMCRLATGGGFATRELYTDTDETLFAGTRPIIVNSIDDVVVRADLADRSIILTLERIADDKRRPEGDLEREFEAARPAIFGALLDVVAHGLRNAGAKPPSDLPRMADFSVWMAACEGALPWPKGTFAEAYKLNRESGEVALLDADPVGLVLQRFMQPEEGEPGGAAERERIAKDHRDAPKGAWVGTAERLLGLLGFMADDDTRRSRLWPHTPLQLSNRLRRAAPVLRSVGIAVETDRAHGQRLITLRRTSEPPTPSAAKKAPF